MYDQSLPETVPNDLQERISFGGEVDTPELPQVTSEEVLEALGGPMAVNGLSVALQDPPATAAEVLEALGGPCAVNGLACALREILRPVRTGPNATAQWLAKNWASLRPKLIAHLENKLRTSRAINVIEDHVQEFVVKLIRGDVLAEHLASGKKVLDSVLRVWVFQAACTEFRGWGTDASLRETRGALTARERAGVHMAVQSSDPAKEVCSPRDIGDPSETTRDLYDPSEGSAETWLLLRERVETHRRTIQKAVPAGSAERYMTVVDAILSGMPRRELASHTGIEPHRINAMFSRMREIITRSSRA